MKVVPARVLVFLFTVAAFGMIAAAPAAAEQNSDGAIVGSWYATITASDPAGLEPFKDLFSFNADGVVVEGRRLYVPDTPFGPLIESPGHGAWVRAAKRQYKIKFLFLLQDFPGGVQIGNDNIEIVAEVSKDGNTMTGTFVSQVRDPETNTVVMFQAIGTVQGTRIRAD
jgi:hypothetical protein